MKEFYVLINQLDLEIKRFNKISHLINNERKFSYLTILIYLAYQSFQSFALIELDKDVDIKTYNKNVNYIANKYLYHLSNEGYLFEKIAFVNLVVALINQINEEMKLKSEKLGRLKLRTKKAVELHNKLVAEKNKKLSPNERLFNSIIGKDAYIPETIEEAEGDLLFY